uniref:ZU5 domain-containing protein n=1 Tax=Amphimedon queenslandica TaxID=400682 RepID=A0A1X7TZP2_AMPQE
MRAEKWDNVFVIGQCNIPPADGFVLEKISNKRAVLFGGIVQDDKTEAIASNDMYLLNIDISLSTVFWQCIKKPEAIDQWPVGRYNHAGAIIVTKFECPLLVICGGMNNDDDTLDDCWIFDTAQRTWQKIGGIDHSFSQRWAHSLSVFTLSPRCFWIIIVGGAFVSRKKVTAVTDELVLYPFITVTKSLVFDKEKIMVKNIPVDLSNNWQYQNTYFQQLQQGRLHWLEYQKQKEEVQVLPSSTAQKWEGHKLAECKKLLKQQELETQAIKQQLRNEQDHSRHLSIKIEKKETEHYLQLQEKEQKYHQLQEIKAEKELEIQRICFQLQEKLEREKAAKDLEIQNYHHRLQEKEQEMQEYYHHFDQLKGKEAEIQRCHFQLEEQEREKAKADQKIQKYLQQLQEKEKEIQNYINQLQEYCDQLLEKEREKAEKDKKIQKCQYQLQEKEKTDALSKQEIQKCHEQLEEKEQENLKKEKEIQESEREKTETKQKHSQQLSEKETEIQRCHQHLRKKEAETEQYRHQLKENEKKYIQQLRQKDKELSEKQQYHHLQLQENEAKMKQRIQNFDHELQKLKKELEDKEKEAQRLNQLLLKEQEEKDKKIQQLLQQIQQHKHQLQENDSMIQVQKEKAEEKVQGIKLLHSSQTMFDEYKEQVPIVPSKQKEQLDTKAAESVTKTEDKLKGVHVADKKSFLIHGGSDPSVKWEEYGIRITIPQGAVLPSDTVQVTITTLVGGDFIFPEDTELVSAVYAISLSKPFLEPVKLEIQHCVSIKIPAHGNYLSFFTTTNNLPPYNFNTVDGGEFSVGNRYGSINTANFSKWSIVMERRRRTRVHPYRIEKSSHKKEHKSLSVSSSSQSSTNLEESSMLLDIEELPVIPLSPNRTIDTSEQNQLMTHILVEDELPVKLYSGQVIYEVIIAGREWLMRFLLCQDLKALIEHIKKEFKSSKEYMEIYFQFKDYDGYIELCFNDKKCSKGWSVRPYQKPSKVSQNVIDDYGSMFPPRFPKCVFTITATPGKDADKELNYPITTQGIKSDIKEINIVLTMGDFQQKPTGTIASPPAGPSSPTEERKLKLAGKVLRDNFDTLSEILAAPSNLSAVIMSLYAKELITDAISTECMNTGRPVQDRCASLLFALKSTVATQTQAMSTLMEVLKEKEAFKDIAEKMDLQMSLNLYTTH